MGHVTPLPGDLRVHNLATPGTYAVSSVKARFEVNVSAMSDPTLWGIYIWSYGPRWDSPFPFELLKAAISHITRREVITIEDFSDGNGHGRFRVVFHDGRR